MSFSICLPCMATLPPIQHSSQVGLQVEQSIYCCNAKLPLEDSLFGVGFSFELGEDGRFHKECNEGIALVPPCHCLLTH